MPLIRQPIVQSILHSGFPSKTVAADRLIVFARHPEQGKVKTRLIPALGAERATLLHSALVQKTLSNAQSLLSKHRTDFELRLCGDGANEIAKINHDGFKVLPQRGSNLGKRLAQAARSAFCEGVNRVVLIGTDCPDLDGRILQNAFDQLNTSDVVLGPAEDGGYYLIGMRRFLPDLFDDIQWGSDVVLSQTKAIAKRLRVRLSELSPLSDVDHAEDLIVCRRHEDAFKNVFPAIQPGLLSVVIPTFNDATSLKSTLAQLTRQPNVKVIVADGGSTDRTVENCCNHPVKVVHCRKGRGRQMNAGAAQTSGEAILFLHADTRLPENFVERIWSVLSAGAIAGSFQLGIDGQHRGLRMVEAGANFRSRFFQIPYGDQGLYLRSETFFATGGFRQWPLMEDYEFCHRLRRLGRIETAPESVATSARRWVEMGVVRNTLLNQFFIAAYRLGVSPDRLAEWYYLARKQK